MFHTTAAQSSRAYTSAFNIEVSVGTLETSSGALDEIGILAEPQVVGRLAITQVRVDKARISAS